MTNQEAKRILDPATTKEALVEIEYYAGFSGQEAKIKAVEEACSLACIALDQSDEWILCENKMPEEKPVIVYPDWKHSDKVIVTFYDEENDEYTTDTDFTLQGKWYKDKDRKIIAWKKLPKPYIPDQDAK